MTLPYYPITEIPDTKPKAIPSLWNSRYDEIDANFASLDGRVDAISCNPAITTNLGYNGVFWSAAAGESVAFGDVCYLKSDGKFWKADADAETTAKGLLAMATAIIDANASGLFLQKGFIRNDSWNFTIGAELFVPLTPGNPAETKPSVVGDIVRIVGYSYSANIIWFDPSKTYVEVG